MHSTASCYQGACVDVSCTLTSLYEHFALYKHVYGIWFLVGLMQEDCVLVSDMGSVERVSSCKNYAEP